MSIRKTEVENALDAIYSRCTTEQQKLLQSEFDLLRQFINDKTPKKEVAPKSSGGHDYTYLDDLSQEAKNLVIVLVDKGEKNLYHSIMAVIDGQVKKNKNVSKGTVKEYYRKRFENRDHVKHSWKLVSEVFDLCWKRYQSKK